MADAAVLLRTNPRYLENVRASQRLEDLAGKIVSISDYQTALAVKAELLETKDRIEQQVTEMNIEETEARGAARQDRARLDHRWLTRLDKARQHKKRNIGRICELQALLKTVMAQRGLRQVQPPVLDQEGMDGRARRRRNGALFSIAKYALSMDPTRENLPDHVRDAMAVLDEVHGEWWVDRPDRLDTNSVTRVPGGGR